MSYGQTTFLDREDRTTLAARAHRLVARCPPGWQDLPFSLVVAAHDARPAFARDYDGVRVDFLTLDRLVERIAGT
jgi:hypothetical protein